MEPAALQRARTRFEDALDFVTRLVRRAEFETHEVRVNIFHWGDPRAWADRVSPGISTVNCHTLSQAKCYVHELGHTIEFSAPNLRNRLAAFLAERTKGERPRRMSVLTGISGYGPKEVARPDRLAHPYMGRDYGTGDTELLSMGIEYLFTDPVELASRDPEFFDLLVALVKGVEP